MEAELIYFASPDEWRTWLSKHGQEQTEVWVGLYKKDSGKTGISYLEALEEALCFGWIDGLTKRVDEASYKIRFTPRRARSNWSVPNVKHVEALIKDGRMTPLGMVPIKAAKADGRWPETS